jgi:hypothetical protein
MSSLAGGVRQTVCAYTCGMRTLVVVLLSWTVTVVAIGAIFGGREVGRACLALDGTQASQRCVAGAQAAYVPPPALLDPSLPWMWLAIWLTGCLVVLAINRVGRV